MHFLCILVTKDFAHADLADADFSQTKIKALTILELGSIVVRAISICDIVSDCVQKVSWRNI